MTAYVLDAGCRRLDGGSVLLGGSPLRLFRLSPPGARLIEALAEGRDLEPSAAESVLVDRLLDAGVIHPRPTGAPFSAADVTVVIPVLGRDVSALVTALGPVGRVIVVDDGSRPPLAPVPGTETVRREVNGGPAAARMTGFGLVATPLVAFVDADVEPEQGWIEPLLEHFADDRVGLAAPRVTSGAARPPNRYRIGADRQTSSLLARYEASRSPLDLGPTEGRVRARTRVSYVPAAAIVVRCEALHVVGGFDVELRVGEDVDLVWRLDEAGWRCRYDPRAHVRHEPRRNPAAWVRQRVGYGRSCGPLARRHPGALAPVAVSGWSAGAWGLAAAGWPLAGAGLTLGTTLALARKLEALRHPLRESLRLAGTGTLFAGGQLAAAVTRVWWPPSLLAALVSRRARRAVLAAALVPPALDWWQRRPPLDPVRYVALRLLDDLAYGYGVWQGSLAAGTADPLLPDLTSWPRSGRYDRTTRGADTATS